GDTELRREDEPAAERERPEAAVAKRARAVGRADICLGTLAEDEAADRGSRHAGESERREPPGDSARVDDRRPGDGDDEARERDRGLPDSERKPAATSGEPLHDRPAAGRLHT